MKRTRVDKLNALVLSSLISVLEDQTVVGKKSLTSKLTNFQWLGNRQMVVRSITVEGPDNMLDRIVRLPLTFDEVKKLYQLMLEAEIDITEKERKLAQQNAENDPEQSS